MKPINVHAGRVVCIDRDNVDTDQILPKQFMKRIERNGYEDYLFYDWRRTENGDVDKTFVLNWPQCAQATIMITGKNFGCGSAREHAVWALSDYGIRVLIGTHFSKIFYLNCINNGILPAIIAESDHLHLIGYFKVTQQPLDIIVDLINQKISLPNGARIHFTVDGASKERLLDGKDEIEITLGYMDKISEFENVQRTKQPWLWERDDILESM